MCLNEIEKGIKGEDWKRLQELSNQFKLGSRDLFVRM